MNYIDLYGMLNELESRPMTYPPDPAFLLVLRERLERVQSEIDDLIDASGSLGYTPEERLEGVTSFLWPNFRPEGEADADSAELKFDDVLLSLFMQPGRRTFDIVVTCTNASHRRAGMSLTTTRDELAKVVLELLVKTLLSTHEVEAAAKASRNLLQSLLNEAVKPT